jgi:hypothetical protein
MGTPELDIPVTSGMHHIGVTGTRKGMTNYQMRCVNSFLVDLASSKKPTRVALHHGDCVGVDLEVAELAASIGMWVVCHPPINKELRAYHESDEIRAPAGYMSRDRDIVRESICLMVVPMDEYVASGGTWYTYNEARKMRKITEIFWPSELH